MGWQVGGGRWGGGAGVCVCVCVGGGGVGRWGGRVGEGDII